MSADQRLRERFCPHVWLTDREMQHLTTDERWELATDRRRAAVREYARQHGLMVDEAHRRIWPPLKFATRDDALAHVAQQEAEPWHEPCRAEAEARAARRAEAVRERKRAMAGRS